MHTNKTEINTNNIFNLTLTIIFLSHLILLYRKRTTNPLLVLNTLRRLQVNSTQHSSFFSLETTSFLIFLPSTLCQWPGKGNRIAKLSNYDLYAEPGAIGEQREIQSYGHLSLCRPRGQQKSMQSTYRRTKTMHYM